MDLVNATPLAAEAVTTELDESLPRVGMIVAKATFRFDGSGRAELDRDDPLPLFRGDEETELGSLPDDMVARRDDAFEVVLHGEAVAPGERAVPSMHVTLAVGERARHLLVTGDRWWKITLDRSGRVAPDACSPTEAEPFLRMPLTWERAWGGRAEVLVDEEAPLELTHALNPWGRGFDPEPAALQLAERLRAPDGYPRVERVRPLPNVEDPSFPVQRWEDDPPPAGWATLPLGSPIRMRAAFPPGKEPPPGPIGPSTVPPEVFHRAHPDWVLPLPEAGERIFLRGMLADAFEVSFALPRLRVLADYVSGERRGTRELRPHLLALLPSERRFYLLYRALFHFDFEPMDERCLRIRTEEGWFVDARGGT